MLSLNKISISVLTFFMFLCFLFCGSMPICYSKVDDNGIKSSVLIEYDTGKILSENNMSAKMPIASVTKLMTILLVLERVDEGNLDLEKLVTASENAANMGGSQVFIEKGGEYRVLDLLKATIISSANDASVMLAEEVSGNEKEFVNKMNQKAEQIGLKNTHYVNSTGLPAPMQYSSAEDVALVMREVLKHPLYLKLSSIWMENFSHPKGRVTTMSNTNKLLKSYDLCDGGKTGSTAEAGFCLCATAKKGDMRLISVVLGAGTSKTRFEESEKLFEYGFNNFEKTKLVDSSKDLGEGVTIQKATKDSIILHPERDFCVVTKKGEESSFSAELIVDKVIFAPIKAGEKVGVIKIMENNCVIDEIAVIVGEDVNAVGYYQTIQHIIKRWLI